MTTQKVRMAFEPEGKVVAIDSILPMRTISPATRQSAKYLRILTSIREIGIVEPIVVYPESGRGRSGLYLLLDGHLRLDILRGMGQKKVMCLVSTDDESFTYNHKVNQVTPVQEHFMILKALENGVSEERIAVTLNLEVSSIRKKRDLLDGICPEAVQLLRDKRVTAGALRPLKKVLPLRQIAMAELMIASDNFSSSYAQCLLAATPQDDLVEKEVPKEIAGLRPQDLARIEREMKVLEKDFRRIEASHGRNSLNTTLVAVFIRRLLTNSAVRSYLAKNYADILGEFEKLVAATDLSETVSETEDA